MSKLRNRKEQRAAAKILADNVVYSDPMLHIDAFLLKIKEEEEREELMILPPQMKACTCSINAHYCSRLLRNSYWFSKNFGCDIARRYHVLFDLADELPSSVFTKEGYGIKQVEVLQLNDDEIYLELDSLNTRCDEIAGFIKANLRKHLPLWSPIHQILKTNLLQMIYSIKKCRTKTILREHLHDILPVNEERRRLLPTLLISVGQTRIYPFQMTIKYDGNFSLPVDYS